MENSEAVEESRQRREEVKVKEMQQEEWKQEINHNYSEGCMGVVWEPWRKCTFTHLAVLLLSHTGFTVISTSAVSLADLILC